jgi:hypothetical protein
VVFFAVQWIFADFLFSPAARTRIFGVDRMDYSVPPEIQARWHRINPPDALIIGLIKALAIGYLSTRVALAWGNWMARVQR